MSFCPYLEMIDNRVRTQDSGWCVSMWESELPWRYLALIPISVCSEHCGIVEGGLEIFQVDLELSSDFEQSSRLRCQRLIKNNRLRLIWWSFEFWKNYLPSAVVNCRLDDASKHGEGPERGKGKKKDFDGLIRRNLSVFCSTFRGPGSISFLLWWWSVTKGRGGF